MFFVACHCSTFLPNLDWTSESSGAGLFNCHCIPVELTLRECSLYGTQEAAQANYHIGIDIDQDGLACEHLPSRSYYAPSASSRLYHSSTCTLRPDTNIRSGPSVESSVIANETTLLSDAIEIHSSEIGRDGQYWSWIGFQGSDGRTAGWVRSDFIQPCS